MPPTAGWATLCALPGRDVEVIETRTLECEGCGAALQVAPSERTVVCPYCAAPSTIERPATRDRPDPTFTVGFVLDRERAAERARRWLRTSNPFARSAFRAATLDATRSVYLPAYLYGAVAHADYSASIGEHYQVVETYTTTDARGRTQVRRRTRTETEWRALSGRYASYVRDVVVTASRALPNAELHAVEPFDLRALRRYDPAMVSGWTSEEPSLGQQECLELGRQEAQASLEHELRRFMPGDTHRGLRYQPSLQDEVLDLVLLPLWIFAVRYDTAKEPVRIVVNGQTGKVAGKVPLSPIKIGLAIALLLALVVAFYLGAKP